MLFAPGVAHCTLYGPAPEPETTVPPAKFQLKLEPKAKVPLAEIVTGAPVQPLAGAEIDTVGGACTLTEAVAGKEVQPAVVTVNDGVKVPAVA